MSARPEEHAADLARRIARGEEDAFRRFWDLWFERVLVLARRWSGRDESFCLDIAQEVFLKVVRSIREVESDEEVERWMRRVVRTTAVDHLRRELRASQRELAARERVPGPGELDARSSVELEEEVAWLRARLAELAPEDREVLRARYLHGRPVERIAAELGTTANAVYGRLRRALARLRRRAREPWGELI